VTPRHDAGGPVAGAAERRRGDRRADALRVRFSEVFGDCPVPIPVEAIAEDLLGLAVLTGTALPVSGLLVVPRREIWVEASDTAMRRRFTVAHEIGHWVCHRNGAPAVCHLESGAPPPHDPREREANVFAAELLMPEAAVRAGHAREASAAALAAAFAVSPEAMSWRLFNLGIAPRPEKEDAGAGLTG